MKIESRKGNENTTMLKYHFLINIPRLNGKLINVQLWGDNLLAMYAKMPWQFFFNIHTEVCP